MTIFTISDSRVSQPGGPGPRIYIPQGGPVIPPGTGFPFRRLLRLAGLRWRHSTPLPHGINPELFAPIVKITPRHGPHRKHLSSITACVFVSAETCLRIRCPETPCITPLIKNPLPFQLTLLRGRYPATDLYATVLLVCIVYVCVLK
jgi:hypothetical protein